MRAEHRRTSTNESGEHVPGRTDGHVGEIHLRDGQRLDGGGDGTDCPAREGLVDQDCGYSEAGDDDRDPEESGRPSVSSYVGQTVYGGGTQELLDIHLGGFLLTETRGGSF